MRLFDPNDKATSYVQEDEIDWCRENPTAPGAAWLLGLFEAWWRQPTDDIVDEIRKATEMFRSLRPRQPFRMKAFYVWMAYDRQRDREWVPGVEGLVSIPLISTDLISARSGLVNTRKYQGLAGTPLVLWRFPFDRVIPDEKIAYLRSRNRPGKLDEYFAYVAQPLPHRDDTLPGYIVAKTMQSTFMANSVADQIREMVPTLAGMRKAKVDVELRRFVRGEPVADPVFQIAHEVA
jgi:hypothetical protein